MSAEFSHSQGQKRKFIENPYRPTKYQRTPMSKIGGKSQKADNSRFVLGRVGFAMISAVEGMSLTPAMTGRAVPNSMPLTSVDEWVQKHGFLLHGPGSIL